VHGATVEQFDLMAGASPELAAAFQTVSDTEAEGLPKFSPRTHRSLVRSVVCRAYGPAMLEVCHLITVAEACSRRPRRYEEFFWTSGPACAQGFRAYVDRELLEEADAEPQVAADHAKVEIGYADGGFAITYSRMPFLSAMVEFLITVLGYGELDDVWQAMLARGPTAASVSEAANRLSRLLYGYLKDQLPTAQNHRKFSCLVGFLQDLGNGDFGPAAIEDPVVLDFWLAQSGKQGAESPDFRTFASVFRAFVRLRQVLDEAQSFQALRNPRPIGPDREVGEVDPDSICTMVESVEETGNPLAVLRDPPAKAIKFLNKAEAADLDTLIACGKTGLLLPLSLLRCEVFGAAQARISQGRRRKLTSEALRALVEDCVPGDYLAHQSRLAQLTKHIDRVLLASLDVLALARRPEAVAVVTALRPDVDLRPLAKVLIAGDDDGKIVRLDGPAMRRGLVAALGCERTMGPELATLMGEASRAFKSLSRQGFNEADAAGPAAGEGFASGAQPLIEIRRQLIAFRRKLRRVSLPQGDWEEQFGEDWEIFRAQFRLLYGVAA
jgi:hypothetical protein